LYALTIYCYNNIYCNTQPDGDHYPVTLNLLKNSSHIAPSDAYQTIGQIIGYTGCTTGDYRPGSSGVWPWPFSALGSFLTSGDATPNGIVFGQDTDGKGNPANAAYRKKISNNASELKYNSDREDKRNITIRMVEEFRNEGYFYGKRRKCGSHCGIFGELDSKNPAVSNHRGIRTTGLQKSRGFDSLRVFRRSRLPNSRGLRVIDSEHPAISESWRDFWTTSLRKSRGLEMPRDFGKLDFQNRADN
jgi:hypothetical protein